MPSSRLAVSDPERVRDSPPLAGVSAARSRLACSRRMCRSSPGDGSAAASTTCTVCANRAPAGDWPPHEPALRPPAGQGPDSGVSPATLAGQGRLPRRGRLAGPGRRNRDRPALLLLNETGYHGLVHGDACPDDVRFPMAAAGSSIPGIQAGARSPSARLTCWRPSRAAGAPAACLPRWLRPPCRPAAAISRRRAPAPDLRGMRP